MEDQKNYSIKNFLDKDIIDIIHKKEIIKWSKYEKKKYDQYLNILYPILNKIHKLNHGKQFWDILLGPFLLLHIAFCCRYYYSKLQKKNRFKKISKNKIKILHSKSYYVPENTEDHREYFQYSDAGQNQLFSQLIMNFNKKNYDLFKKKKKKIIINRDIIKEKIIKLRQYLSIKIFQPKLLVTGAYMPAKFISQLKLRHKRNISFIKFYIPTFFNKDIFWLERNEISTLKSRNNFDKFFLSTLKFSLPKSLLENFNYNYSYSKNFLDNFKKLKFILNENMTEDNLFLIACATIKKIKTIYVEHNYIQHQFIGNTIDYIKNKFDFFLTNGWKVKKKNIISAGSYFFPNELKKTIYNNKKKILFISGPTLKRPPYTCSAHDSHDETNRNTFVKVTKDFFNNLDNEILSNMKIRLHPNKLNRHDSYKKMFKSKAQKVKIINHSKETFNHSLLNSDFVVNNYLGTPYLQSLCMNKPTLIIYNPKAYFLNSDNHNFYDDLFKANIMHKNPIQAAKFIKKIWKNPYEWWQSKRTQTLRKSFLDRNIKDSFYLQSKIKKLLN